MKHAVVIALGELAEAPLDLKRSESPWANGTNPRLETFGDGCKNWTRDLTLYDMPRRSTPWTDEDELERGRLSGAGISVNRMSIRLGRTKRAIEVRLAELRRRSASKEDDQTSP